MTVFTKVNAVVFDMDGVLWNSGHAHATAYSTVLRDAGLVPPEYHDIAGRRTDAVIKSLLTEQRPDMADDLELIHNLTRAKQAIAIEILRSNPPIMPNCREVIYNLAESFPIALASSASAGSVELFLEASGTRSAFTAMVSGEDVRFGKPDPEIYLEAINRLGVSASKTAIVEDAVSGIIAAVAAHAELIVGITGTTSSDALMNAGAHLTVDCLRDLLFYNAYNL